MNLKTFAELELIAPLQRALADEKYERPTPIQAQTIPVAIDGRDVLGCAQTGTGKTAAFALPILNRLGQQHRKAKPNRPLALILAPTRELAIQISDSFAAYGRHLHLRHALVYGGVSQGKQVRALQRGVHALIATPGRLLDLMSQGHIELDQLEVFVLDEADRMMDMGFLPDLKRVIKKLPRKRQSLFFSATMPPNIVELSQQLLHNEVKVNVTPKTTSVKAIEQSVVFVERGGKQSLLQSILNSKGVKRTLVFTRTKRGANVLATKLERNGFRATAIHGDKSQSARQKALESFRKNHVQVLVATDVAARGIDVDGITHVVNFDMPVEPDSYVHRVGRTGRAGAAGVALSFCTANEYGELRAIEQLIGEKLSVDRVKGQPTHPRPEGHRSTVGGRKPTQSRSSKRKSGGPKNGDKAGKSGQAKQKRSRRKWPRAKQTTKPANA